MLYEDEDVPVDSPPDEPELVPPPLAVGAAVGAAGREGAGTRVVVEGWVTNGRMSSLVLLLGKPAMATPAKRASTTTARRSHCWLRTPSL